MLVVEGRVGKSLKLQEIIDNHEGTVLMVDCVGVHHIQGANLWVVPIHEKFWNVEWTDGAINDLRNYDLIIFEVNDDKTKLDYYKDMEKRIQKKCVVTIQNNNLEELNVYEV